MSDAYKEWKLNNLPIIPQEFLLKPIPETKTQLTTLDKLMHRKDIGHIINGCDAGREGELVLTNLGRLGSPLLRYRTGDRVVVDPQPCPCGSIFVRLRGGILGRSDDMLIVRGTNVYPSALEAIVRRFPEVEEFRIVVQGSELRLEVEPRRSSPPPDLVGKITEAIRSELLFRADVAIVAAGSLPRAEMKSQRVLRVP